MAFLASNIIPQLGYRDAKQVSISLKNQCGVFITNISSGSNADYVLRILQMLSRDYQILIDIKNIPGIGQYAKDQEQDTNYDVVAEFDAMLNSIDSASEWIRTSLPVDANDYLLTHKLVNDLPSPRTFTQAVMAPLVTLLQEISNSIN